MTSTDLAVRTAEQFAPLEAASNLPQGSIHLLGLQLTDHSMTLDEWQDIGRNLGSARRWSAFALGDWLNFGEELYGESAAQGVEGAPAERYDVAHRVTGLEEGTLRNYSSVCRRVSLDRRRVELDWGHHEAVAALEPDEQIRWLQTAVDKSMTRDELRQAIKDEKNPVEDDGEGGSVTVLPNLSLSERKDALLELIYQQAQPDSDGNYVVPGEVIAQVAAVLGRE